MSALSLLVLCAVFVLLVILYLTLVRVNSWRLSDASRRATIIKWLQQGGKDQSPPSCERIIELLNKHFQNCLRTRRTTTSDVLGLETITLEQLQLPVDHLYHVISINDDDNNKLVTLVGVSLHNVNTEWIITTTKYGTVSCNVFFHCYDTRVTMEFNKVQDNLISFGVHQLEPVNIDLSVTVTSPAMKDPVSVGNQVAMVIQSYLCCVNWSDEGLVARAAPSCWESFTPKELVAKETFFTDDSSPADVSMDTAITNVDSKEASVIQDTTWVAMGTPSPTESNKEITSSVVKEDVPVVTKDTPTAFNQSQCADKKPHSIPSLLLSSHDPQSVNTSLESPVNNDGDHGNSDNHDNNDQHPTSITLNDKSPELDTIAMETLNDHTGSYSVPVTPMKPYQSSSKNSDYHQHRPLFPRRSHSYEHLEELGLSPLASSPANHSASQSNSGPFRFRGNILASVGSSSDVLEDMSDVANNNRSDVASYVSTNSTSSASQPTLLVFEFQESGITRHIAVDTTLDKVPRFRNATKLHIWNDHVFVASHLKSTVVCEVCNKKIHRILGKRNVYVCRDCKMCTHKHCHGNVKEACPNSSYHHMTINYAESSNTN